MNTIRDARLMVGMMRQRMGERPWPDPGEKQAPGDGYANALRESFPGPGEWPEGLNPKWHARTRQRLLFAAAVLEDMERDTPELMMPDGVTMEIVIHAMTDLWEAEGERWMMRRLRGR